jgi:hypothetical protein
MFLKFTQLTRVTGGTPTNAFLVIRKLDTLEGDLANSVFIILLIQRILTHSIAQPCQGSRQESK